MIIFSIAVVFSIFCQNSNNTNIKLDLAINDIQARVRKSIEKSNNFFIDNKGSLIINEKEYTHIFFTKEGYQIYQNYRFYESVVDSVIFKFANSATIYRDINGNKCVLGGTPHLIIIVKSLKEECNTIVKIPSYAESSMDNIVFF